MATENKNQTTTITALENLEGYQYHAIALSDGLRAADGQQASGIIKNKPRSGEAATVTISGESFFFAGGAVTTPGYPLTVNASGTFEAWTAPSSGASNYAIGTAKAAVSSGAVGTGLFDFTTPVQMQVP